MNRLLETLRRHEGVEYFVYKDHLGYETIGVGRCISPDVGLGLSNEEVNYLLLNDVKRCLVELERAFPWFKDLDEVRRNLGLSRLRKFKKALAAMSEKDYILAASEFLDSRWATQVGNRAIEVTDIIRTGEYNGG